ncbi:hypothetical protein LCGC14_1320230 [marine sediment metagenome]|uniref:Uncharacterized protein n=1 Tax=marine sediment metagenome TaxID=412755 RepID=A0A0F9NM27_9ZZZZ
MPNEEPKIMVKLAPWVQEFLDAHPDAGIDKLIAEMESRQQAVAEGAFPVKTKEIADA